MFWLNLDLRFQVKGWTWSPGSSGWGEARGLSAQAPEGPSSPGSPPFSPLPTSAQPASQGRALHAPTPRMVPWPHGVRPCPAPPSRAPLPTAPRGSPRSTILPLVLFPLPPSPFPTARPLHTPGLARAPAPPTAVLAPVSAHVWLPQRCLLHPLLSVHVPSLFLSLPPCHTSASDLGWGPDSTSSPWCGPEPCSERVSLWLFPPHCNPRPRCRGLLGSSPSRRCTQLKPGPAVHQTQPPVPRASLPSLRPPALHLESCRGKATLQRDSTHTTLLKGRLYSLLGAAAL